MAAWYTPSLLPDQLFQARLKAHDAIQEHLKQLITVSAATIALTVTFLKDIVQAPAAASHRPLLFLGWGFLLICIVFAVLAISVLVNSLDRSNSALGGDGYPVAFAAGHLPLTRFLVLVSFGFFVAGLALLALFTWINVPASRNPKQQPPVVTKTTLSWSTQLLGSLADFGVGRSTLESISGYDPAQRLNEICSAWMQSSSKDSCAPLLIVGSADRQPLRATLRRQYESNMGLARARAETVRAALMNCALKCPSTRDTAVVFVTGPGITVPGLAASGGLDMGADRSVMVWTIKGSGITGEQESSPSGK